jgi:hypothetical protein
MPGMTNVAAELADDCTDIEPTLFRRITRRIAAEHEEVDIGEAERITVGTIRFLRVCARYPHHRLVPSRKIDIGWHTFILYTSECAAFCEALGGFIHHEPNDSDSDGLDEPAASAQVTVGFMRSLGIPFDAGLWASSGAHDCESGGKCHGGSCAGRCSGTPTNSDVRRSGLVPSA